MRYGRQLLGSTVLTLVLTQATLGGEGVVYPWVTPPPPPPPSTTVIVNPVQTDDSVKSTSEDGTVDLVTEATLSLVRSLLALF
jgi:hypothetical protein